MHRQTILIPTKAGTIELNLPEPLLKLNAVERFLADLQHTGYTPVRQTTPTITVPQILLHVLGQHMACRMDLDILTPYCSWNKHELDAHQTATRLATDLTDDLPYTGQPYTANWQEILTAYIDGLTFALTHDRSDLTDSDLTGDSPDDLPTISPSPTPNAA